MKKITGKALSLVLSLALVISSFSAAFAFAATTKTLTGIVNKQAHDDVYLVNGGGREIDLNAWLVDNDPDTLKTNTRDSVDNPKVSAISHVSGDSLVSLSLSSSGDDATLKLKSASKDGTEVISVLYKGDYTDEDGNEYTVKARKNVTVHVFDKDSIVFGEEGFAGAAGEAPDDFETFAKTRNFTKGIGIYVAEPSAADDKTANAALAIYEPVALTAATKDIPAADLATKIPSTLTSDELFSIEVSGGDINLDETTLKPDGTAGDFDSASGALQATVGKETDSTKTGFDKDSSTANVTITLKKVDKATGKISTSSDDKYVLKTKVENKVDVKTALTNDSSNTATTFNIVKDSKTVIKEINDSATGKKLDVTDSIVVFPDTTTKVTVDEKTNVKGIEGTVGQLSIGDGKVGYVDIDSGDVDLADGKVGDITTAAPSGKSGNVTITSGTAGNIKTTDVKDDSAGNVTVYGGTVGTIKSNDTVTLDSNDEDTKITTGVITAPDVDIYSDEATIAVAGLVAKADGTLTIKGSDVTVKSIDLDSFDSALTLGDEDDAFNGSIPAPKNATKGSIETVNDDTRVSVAGNVNINDINLASKTVATFDGSITADTVEGDGILTIKAGNLYVTGSVSSTILKLSDTTLASGTTVFKSDSDTVDVDDFSPYGFTLTKSEGSSVDTFKIDTLKFAGLAINKSSSKIAVGYSETFTGSAYPGGTSLPEGYTIGWELDGGSSDVFSLTTSGNTATVTVEKLDDTFASENHTTLTAKLYDKDGYEVDEDDYGVATTDITAIAVPEIVSDTTSNFSIAPGASYTFKLTSATQPVLTTGTGGVFSVTDVGKSGNDYFVKITAIGKVGAESGIYVNGVKLLVASIKSGITSDTTTDITVKKGASYTYKITAPSAPTFSVGTANVLTYKLTSQSGNNYFYQITAVGAVGAKAGIYVNGEKINAVTIG